MSKKNAIIVCVVLGVVMVSGLSLGMMMLDQTKTFNVTSGDWDVGDNWLPAGEGVPGAGDFVIIPTGKTCNVDQATNRVKTIEVQTGAALNVKAGGTVELGFSGGLTSTITGNVTLESSTSSIDIFNSHTFSGTGKIIGQNDSAEIWFSEDKILTSNIIIEGRLKITSDNLGLLTIFVNLKTVHANAAGTLWVNARFVDDSDTGLWKISTSSSAVLRFDPLISGFASAMQLEGDFTIESGTLDVDFPGFDSYGTLTWTAGTIDCSTSGGIAQCRGS